MNGTTAPAFAAIIDQIALELAALQVSPKPESNRCFLLVFTASCEYLGLTATWTS